MRLYLSSYRLGEHPEELVRLAGPGARVAVIGNAVELDGTPSCTPGTAPARACASDAVAERYRSTGVPHVTLRDGQAMVVDGDTTTVV